MAALQFGIVPQLKKIMGVLIHSALNFCLLLNKNEFEKVKFYNILQFIFMIKKNIIFHKRIRGLSIILSN